MTSKIYNVLGFSGTIQELGKHFGINYRTLATRLRAGWSLEMAVTTPVDKSKSIKLPTVLEVGKIRANPDVLEKRFGVLLDSKERQDSDLTKKKIQKYVKPKFYKVGKSYTGSLMAISEDYGCPVSELKAGMKKGLTPAQVLENGDYLGG